MTHQLDPHPTPESFGMEAVTKEQFLTWLTAQTVDVQGSSYHSAFLEGKVWSEYKIRGIGPVIGRHYCDYMGGSVNHMLLPRFAAEARALVATAPAS